MFPYAKTGGLADMVASLSRHLSHLGHDVKVILPYYRSIKEMKLLPEIFIDNLVVKTGKESTNCKIYEHLEVDSGVSVYFVEKNEYFNRSGFYNDSNIDYKDNAERFIFFAHAAVQLSRYFKSNIDILHCHDWQSALPIALLKADINIPEQLNKTHSVFTIHNLGYQGNFDSYNFSKTGLPTEYFSTEGLEFYGQLSLIKAGIIYSDIITTVSPNYAKEIQTEDYGFGMEGILKKRKNHLIGILNGIDESIWNPAKDPCLICHFDHTTIEKKKICKVNLQEKMSLNRNTATPLIGGISRLIHQKGYDMVVSALPGLLSHDIQFVLLGTGEPALEEKFNQISKQYSNFKFYNGYNETLAHQIIAGSDIFIIPSRYEPCGLTQMYSLKYGTIPIVNATGGLEDSVRDIKNNLSTGTGIKFSPFSTANFIFNIIKTIELYKNEKNLWYKIMYNGMKENHSWQHRILQYHDLYRNLTRKITKA